MISEEQKQRLLQEQKELHERTIKLVVFFDNDMFLDLDDEMQFLLEAQYNAMVQYEHILLRRMQLLGIILDD
jgi:hypothetical protein